LRHHRRGRPAGPSVADLRPDSVTDGETVELDRICR
jgi:hypothetical protein